MATPQELDVQEKKELASKEEQTKPARYYVPATDIYETSAALVIVMEVPGADKSAVDINVEQEILKIDARIDTTKYKGLEPVYTEYPVGHFARSFALPREIDQQDIRADLKDGVLTVTLNKVPAARPRRIAVTTA